MVRYIRLPSSGFCRAKGILKKLTWSLICCAHLHRSDTGTSLVAGCKAKHGVRESVVAPLIASFSLRSLKKSGEFLLLDTFYRLSTLAVLDISALRPRKAVTTRNKMKGDRN